MPFFWASFVLYYCKCVTPKTKTNYTWVQISGGTPRSLSQPIKYYTNYANYTLTDARITPVQLDGSALTISELKKLKFSIMTLQ